MPARDMSCYWSTGLAVVSHHAVSNLVYGPSVKTSESHTPGIQIWTNNSVANVGSVNIIS